MFTCGITPINDYIFPLDRCILFCHNCNTLTSLYLCVWLACKPASPGVSRATVLKLITPCQCGKLLFPLTGYDMVMASNLGPVIAVVQLPT